MSYVVKTGAAGTAGKDGTAPGLAGTAGGNGGIATATSTASLDGYNTVTATGGAGGAGGDGGSGPGLGGAGGAGGGGGHAAASTAGAIAAILTYSIATATGGAGGRAGTPGNAGSFSTGAGANGGAGGTATSKATDTNATGPARANANAMGGAGGYGAGAGKSGGAAGLASGTTASATGIDAFVTVNQTGGRGGGGYFGASGASGAASSLINAVSGNATSYLHLRQTATGGGGGDGGVGKAGDGGAATSNLTVAGGSVPSFGTFTVATGGDGGASTLGGGAGGAATGSIAATGAKSVSGTVQVNGGTGGAGMGTASGGSAGGVFGTASASSTTTGSDSVFATLTLTGGMGGAGGTGGIGAGGAAISGALATATAASATGGTSTARANAHGGAGGRANGAGGYGGAGGTALGTTASATGFNADVRVDQRGGQGGAGADFATGGIGAPSSLVDAVTGNTAAGGSLSLHQGAFGGRGGDSNGFAGGYGGAASSSLTLTDTAAANLDGRVVATGGNGGGGGTPKPGAAAIGTIALVGAGGVTAHGTATGGAGGYGAGGNAYGIASGGLGGKASSVAAGTSTGNGSGIASVYARAYGGYGGGAAGAGGAGGSATSAATAIGGALSFAGGWAKGGAGGRSNGVGNSGGAGGIASGTTAAASGNDVHVRATQYGGHGGHGYGGATGGAGAASSLTNAVSGSASGYLLLRQVAAGGSGGYSTTSSGGAGGAATSNLSFTTTGAADSVTAMAGAHGGGGGSGSGKAAGAGGDATATLVLTGVAGVVGTASAAGGNGGSISSTQPAIGGAASATASVMATGTGLDGTATATAGATGGYSSKQSSANATAFATTAAGQQAHATAAASGASGIAQANAATPGADPISGGPVGGGPVGGGPVGGVFAQAQSQAGGTADAIAIRGTVHEHTNRSHNAYAHASVLPDGAALAPLLAAAPDVAAALGAGNAGALVFGQGVQGAVYPVTATGARSYSSAIAYSIDTSQFSGRLLAGLVDHSIFGTGFATLHFAVTVGAATVVDENFTAAAAAQGYFSNRLLDLGAVLPVASLVVTFRFDLTSSSADNGFGQRFVFGTDNANRPPVNTVPGVQTGQAGSVRPIAGVSINDPDAALGESFTTTLTAASGILATKATAGVVGSGTAALKITGTLASVNAALASLSILAGKAGSDTIQMVTTDSNGGSDSDSIAIATDAGAVIMIAAATLNRTEGTGAAPTPFTFKVNRNGDLAAGPSVKWAVTGMAGIGTVPADAADFANGVLPSGIVIFNAGETSRLVTLGIAADAVGELNNRFLVSLSGPAPGLTIGTAAISGIIQNDDTSLAIGQASVAKAEGQAGTTNFVFTVNRPGPVLPALTVNWAVTGTGGVPAKADDFAGGVLPSGTLSFGALQASGSITVPVTGDTQFEADESFAITLSGASAGAAITTASAIGTILGDDVIVSIGPVSATKPEGTGGTTPFTFKVDRSGDSAAGSSVLWAVTGLIGAGTNPATPADFANGIFPAGIVIFDANETSRLLTLPVAADAAGEFNDRFAVTLSNPSAGVTLGAKSAGGVILNDDSSMAIGPANVVKAEGNAGSTAYVFTVSRPGALLPAATVGWAAAGSGGAAANAGDFAGGVLPAGTLSFAALQTTASITVHVAGDAAVEPDEQFSVTLSGATAGIAITTASATGIITGDDATVAIVAVSASKPEGTGGTTPFTFKVDRSGGSLAGQSVKWAAAGAIGIGTAPADAADFKGGVLPSGTVTFPGGEKSRVITIDVAADAVGELNNRFAVTLSNPSPSVTIAIAVAGGIILNDEITPFTFPLVRTGILAATQAVTFAPGETAKSMTVPVIADAQGENDETFMIPLTSPTGGTTLFNGARFGVSVSDNSGFASSAANETLTGTGGRDRFFLGGGLDSVSGLGGEDHFYFLPAAIGPAAANTATLEDFNPDAGDLIVPCLIDAIAATLAHDTFSYIGQAPFTGTPGQIRYEDHGGMTLIQGNVNNDTIADLTIQIYLASGVTGSVSSSWFAL